MADSASFSVIMQSLKMLGKEANSSKGINLLWRKHTGNSTVNYMLHADEWKDYK